MSEGWIKLYRGVRNCWFWNEEPFSFGQAWVDILLRANHEAKKVPIGNEIITVPAGSFITSELKLMNAWGWGKAKTRRFLKLLENDGMIIKNSDHKKTTINVVNWGKYQITETKNEPVADQSQTDSRPIAETNKNEKNEKNEKKKRGAFVPPTLEEVRTYCLERGNSVSPERFFDYYSANGWVQGKGKPIKDWKACVRTWEGKEKDFSRQQESDYERSMRILREGMNT